MVRGIETDMPEPASDHRDVNSCRDQMHCGRVAKTVGSHMPRCQVWRDFDCCLDILGQFEAHTRRPQPNSVPINEDRFILGSQLPSKQQSKQ